MKKEIILMSVILVYCAVVILLVGRFMILEILKTPIEQPKTSLMVRSSIDKEIFKVAFPLDRFQEEPLFDKIFSD